MAQPRQNDLLGVQALRAVAALMVVGYHAVNQWTQQLPDHSSVDYWPNGAAGVDVFFVISGLVMTISFQRNAGRPRAAWTFARDRIVRIVPLYWIATTAKILAVLAVPALATRTTLDPPYVAGSYAFLPVRDAVGIIQPVLPVGWTLSYEMLFYILIGVALVARAPLVWICLPVLLALSAMSFVLPSDNFIDPILSEFTFGIAIGYAIPRLQSLPASIGAIVGPVALVLLAVVPVVHPSARPLTWGILAACAVAATVSSEALLRQRLPRWLLAAGSASYATYLIHGFVIPVVFLLFRWIPAGGAGFACMIVLSLIGSVIAGQLTHVIVEQPLLLRLRSVRAAATIPASG